MMNEQIEFMDIYDVWYHPWWHSWYFYIVGVLLVIGVLGLLGYAIFRYVKNKPKLVSYDQKALQELQLLKDVSFESLQESYYQLTKVIKEYFSGYYDQFLLDKTDQELEQFLQKRLTKDQMQHIQNILQRSFQIKYANLHVDNETLYKDITFFIALIQKATADKAAQKDSV